MVAAKRPEHIKYVMPVSVVQYLQLQQGRKGTLAQAKDHLRLLSLINVIHRGVNVDEGKAARSNGGVKVQHHAFFWFD